MDKSLPTVPSNDPTRFCRLCFTLENIHWVIRTSGTAVDQPFINTIGECVGVWLKLNSDFPCAVCRSCTAMLEMIIDFRDACRRCDTALSQKRNEDPTAMVLFYDYPEDRVFASGSQKPDFITDDPDFDQEPMSPEVILSDDPVVISKKEFRLSTMEKQIALKRYMYSYASWETKIKRAKDDDEMTIDAPEAVEENRSHARVILQEKQATQKAMQTYKKRLTGQLQTWCYQCKRELNTVANLKNHVATHHPAIGFSCVECGKKFWTQHQLKCHLRRHRASMMITCRKCGIQFTNDSELAAHYKNNCRQRKALICKCAYCDRTFSQRGRYIFHLKTLHPGKALPSRNKIAPKTADGQHLRAHQRQLSLDQRIRTQQGTGTCIERNGHFAVVLKPLSEEYIQDCLDGFIPEVPQVFIKENDEEILCTACFEQFPYMASFREHLEDDCIGHEAGLRAEPYILCPCEFCSTILEDVNLFSEHLRQHIQSLDEKPHQCERCRVGKSPCKERPCTSPVAILGD